MTVAMTDKKRKVPEGIDLTPLNFLQYGDAESVANDLKMSADYVRKCKNLHHYSVKVLSALLKKGRENMSKL
jgi:hypothetical protein